MMNNVKYYVAIFAIILGAYSCKNVKKNVKDETLQEVKQKPVRLKYGIPIDDYRVVKDTVRSNETLSDILLRYNISPRIIHEISEKSKKVFNVRKLRTNHEYSLLFCPDDDLSSPYYFIYEKNLVENVVYCLEDSIQVSIEKKPTKRHTDIYENVIKTNLWNSFVDNNRSPALAMELSDVYQWSIDFYTINKGDSYKVMYTQDYVEGRPLGNIHPIASKFIHGGTTYYAFWFQRGKTKGYFDEKGGSLHKAFLRSPLKFSRISSRFSYSRFHPKLKYYRPHNGVDYAAPTGTPVRSVGDGRVIVKGYQRGGAGNYVKIKHNKIYTTVYMHFVRHARNMYVGKHIKQGDVIGYVGSTGSSTGPHLHFGVKKNGRYINPLSMKSPPSKPLKGKLLKEFKIRRDSLLSLLGE